MRSLGEAPPAIDRQLLRRVMGYGRPYLGKLLGVLITVILISGLSVVPPILIRLLIDEAIPTGDLTALTWLGIGMVAVPVVNAGVGIIQRWWSAQAGEGIIFDLRGQLYAHLQRMSLGFFTNTRTGELISRIQSDVVGAQQAITGTFVTILSNLVSVAAILTVLIGADWRLPLLAVAPLPLFITPARRAARALRAVTERQMKHNANMSSILQETFNVSGALLVKLFDRGSRELGRFSEEAAGVRELGVRSALIGTGFRAAMGVISALGTASVFWVGGWMVIEGHISLGTVVMFSTLLVQLYAPLTALSNTRVEFATSLVSFERVFQVLDIAVDLPEAPDAQELIEVEGEVEFDRVWFRYPSERLQGIGASQRFTPWDALSLEEDTDDQPLVSTRDWALEDISFRVPSGALVAVVGPSGAGKTTLSYLVPRLYEVNRGSVRIDGHDVRGLTFASLARAVGEVTQETYLLHDTIAANLRYAAPDATEQQLWEACETANLTELITALPNGLGTVVGERGYRLSGGEKQRVAIARVILKNPAILVLDEATSHLDTRSEALIQEALERLMRKRTSLVIAHRLSTVQAADVILVIDKGRLVEQGTHDELLEIDGLYATLYQTQFQPVG
ncbi:MAG: ABC transporter ATP-binding protein [bacterium]|nr:ABC transporter ATP-binding protein [bacterium]